MTLNQQEASGHLAARDALVKISTLADAVLCLTTNATERSAQDELIGIISDIANTVAKEWDA